MAASQNEINSLVIIMFTDIEESTRLTNSLPIEKSQELLRLHNETIRASLSSFGGFEIKTIGDSFMVAFFSANDAILCAAEVQMKLFHAEWPPWLLADKRISQKTGYSMCSDEDMQRGLRVRIGIHAGRDWYSETYRGALDYHGSTVNMAARVESQALGGQIIVSEAVWLAVTQNESLDVVAKALGQKKLKSIDEPVNLIEIVPPLLLDRKYRSKDVPPPPPMLEKGAERLDMPPTPQPLQRSKSREETLATEHSECAFCFTPLFVGPVVGFSTSGKRVCSHLFHRECAEWWVANGGKSLGCKLCSRAFCETLQLPPIDSENCKKISSIMMCFILFCMTFSVYAYCLPRRGIMYRVFFRRFRLRRGIVNTGNGRMR